MTHPIRSPALLMILMLSGSPSWATSPLRGNPLWDIPLESLTETQARPLFSPSRRPPPAPADQVSAPQAEPVIPSPPEANTINVVLIGTILDPQGSSAAVLKDNSSQATFIMKIGDIREGWQLSEIHARDILLKSNTAQMTITFAKPSQNITVIKQDPQTP